MKSIFAGRCAQAASAVLAFAAVVMLVVLATPPAQAQTFTTLYTFAGGADGAFPYAGLARDSAGNLYGTTHSGGVSGGCGGTGCGTVFKVDATGQQTVLYTFSGGTDGWWPYAGLIVDARKNLYGTTYYGGKKGLGVVFKVDATGKETVIHTFTGTHSDGEYPQGGLLMDKAHNLYGTTYAGGANTTACPPSCGTVYKLNKKGKETVLHTFSGGADGGLPNYVNLVRDSAGSLYGTTAYGGSGCTYGCGVVFKVDSTGHETPLYTFGGTSDGATPYAGLVRDAAGNLYGTAQYAGLPGGCMFGYGCGVIFKIDAAGNQMVLYSFTGGPDGGNPSAGLVRDKAGNLYGTTQEGGVGFGVVFKLDPSGNETALYTFTGGTDGAQPIANVILDKAGNLYGTTTQRGSTGCNGLGCGTVFEITP